MQYNTVYLHFYHAASFHFAQAETKITEKFALGPYGFRNGNDEIAKAIPLWQQAQSIAFWLLFCGKCKAPLNAKK